MNLDDVVLCVGKYTNLFQYVQDSLLQFPLPTMATNQHRRKFQRSTSLICEKDNMGTTIDVTGMYLVYMITLPTLDIKGVAR